MEGGTGDNAAAAGQDSAVGQVLYAAFQTVLNILLLNLVGVALAWYPKGDNLSIDARGLLTQSTIQALSRLSVTVFLPFAVCRYEALTTEASALRVRRPLRPPGVFFFWSPNKVSSM